MLGRRKCESTQAIIYMRSLSGFTIYSIATGLSVAMLFLSCKDTYERIGEEADTVIYPQGVAQNFVLTYTETNEEMSTEDEDASYRG